MTLRVRLYFILAISCIAFPSSAWSQDTTGEWIRFQTISLDPRTGSRQVAIPVDQGRSRGLRLLVKEGSVRLTRVVITYDNGEIHYQDTDDDQIIALGAGARTATIDASPELPRGVTSIALNYQPSQAGSATIEVEGLQLEPDRQEAATRAAAIKFAAEQTRLEQARADADKRAAAAAAAATAAVAARKTAVVAQPPKPTSSNATPGGTWVLIGRREADLSRGSQTIDLKSASGNFTAFRVQMVDGEAKLTNVQLRYGNGQAHNERRTIHLLDKERTKPIDQSSEQRFVEGATLCFEGNQRGTVTFEIYGLQTKIGASSSRPAITQALTWAAACPGGAAVAQVPTTGPIAATPTAPIPQTAPAGTALPGGAVLFGVQNVGFIRDRDVIRVGPDLGQFDRIQLRILDNDVFINELDVVYVDGETQKLVINSDIKQNTRTRWLNVKADKFIKEISLNYRSKPSFQGQARIEIYGQYPDDWLGANGRGRQYNEGWVLLGAQTANRFLRSESNAIQVGRNEGLFGRIRVTVKDRALVFDELRVIYGNGEEEVIPVKATIAANQTFGPIDIKHGNRVIKEVRAKYRSAMIDAKAVGRGASVVEVWAQHGGGNKGYNDVDVFYATTRKREQDSALPAGRKRATFSTLPGGRTEVGLASVTMPSEPAATSRGPITAALGSMMSVFRSGADPRYVPTITNVLAPEREAFSTAMKSRADNAVKFKGHALIFVHGFRVSFDEALIRAAQFKHGLGFDGPVFAYSWPSRASLTPQDYLRDQKRATDEKEHLIDFIGLVVKETGVEKVDIIAHSMGAFVVFETLRDIGRLVARGGKAPDLRLNEIIFGAADIDRTDFERDAPGLLGMAKGFTIYASSKDTALSTAQSVWDSARVGEVLPPPRGPVVVPGMHTVDITAATADFLGHGTFADKSHFVSDMEAILETSVHPPYKRARQIYRQTGSGAHEYSTYRAN